MYCIRYLPSSATMCEFAQGFICSAEPESRPKIMNTLTEFIIKGQITPKLDVVHGFENTISALAGIFRGDNIG